MAKWYLAGSLNGLPGAETHENPQILGADQPPQKRIPLATFATKPKLMSF